MTLSAAGRNFFSLTAVIGNFSPEVMKAMRAPLANAEAVQKHIRVELYPVELFPISRFPDLMELTLSSFEQQIENDSLKRGLYFNPAPEAELKNLATGIVALPPLLRNDPSTIVLIYQNLIEKFVSFHCRDRSQRGDISQEILARLLDGKLERIRQLYDFENRGIGSFTSYFMVSVRNLYWDVLRSLGGKEISMDEQQIEETVHNSVLPLNDEVTLQREFRKLRAVLSLYNNKRDRLELLIKLKFRLPIDASDVEACYAECTEEETRILSQDFRRETDSALLETVHPILCKYDGVKYKIDSLRRWIDRKVEEIIELMNKTHDKEVYTPEVLELLVHLFYRGR